MRPAERPSDSVTGRVGVLGVLPCEECGRPFECARGDRRYCGPRCYHAAYNRAHPVARQRALPLTPPPAPVPPVRDQRVPRQEQKRLRRMSRLILERVTRGPARASELHAMFPGARSVRTRISEVGRHVGEAWRSAPVKGVVGEWVYWIEGA